LREERMFKYMFCILILVLCLTHGARSVISCAADADCRTNGDSFAACTGNVCVCSPGFTGDICTSSTSFPSWFWWVLGIGFLVFIVFLAVGVCYVCLYSLGNGHVANMDARGRYRRRYYPRDGELLGNTR